MPTPEIFKPKPLSVWVMCGVILLYLLGCWAVFFLIYNPASPAYGVYRVEADSNTYFALAGITVISTRDRSASSVSDSESEQPGETLVAFGGTLLGPVLMAKVLRTPGNVAAFNLFLFLWMLSLAGRIPGVRKRYFALLLIANAQMISAIVTLNKEILASIGVVALMAYFYSRPRSWWLAVIALIFSVAARWEQLAIALLFLMLIHPRSPFRRRPLWSLVFVIAVLTVAYPLALRYTHLNIGAFLVQAGGGGIISRMANIQAVFGFPLILIPRAILNLFNRTLTPWDFLLPGFVFQDFHNLQNAVISPLQSLMMTVVFFVALFRGRLALHRPIPYFIALYVIITCASPFVQPRYQFPVYVLLCLELSRTQASLEPAPRRRAKPQPALQASGAPA